MVVPPEYTLLGFAATKGPGHLPMVEMLTRLVDTRVLPSAHGSAGAAIATVVDRPARAA